MLAANGFSGIAEARQQDLYELTRGDVEAAGATLLVCCEVVEHVPDAEQALATLARALPDGADLLFSVPLLGRLEDVWGHTQVFGAARTHRILEQAGLVAHHVEPLHNTWALVLASRDAAPSPRAAAALENSCSADPTTFVHAPYEAITNTQVKNLHRAASAWTKRVASVSIEQGSSVQDPQGPTGLRVQAAAAPILRGPGRGWASCVGVAFAVPQGTKGVRLQLELADPDSIASFCLEFRSGGARIGRWEWKPGKRRPQSPIPTFVVAQGRDGGFLRSSPGSRIEGADTVEVYTRSKGRAHLDFSLPRWAWIS